MKHNNTIQKMVAMLTVASLAVAVLPGTSDTSVVASASAYNTWTGYMLQNEKGDYLSVAYGTAVEGQSTDFYIANGNAPYNTWYFTETSYGITIKSALSQGKYYLTGNGDGRLTISTTPGIFTFSEDGLLSDRDGISYGMVTLEAVTNLRSGDLNQNDVVDGYDLTILRQLVLYGNANFIQAAMGDVNGDGVITGQDVALLQQYLLGEDVPLVVVTLPDCTIIPSPEESPATTTEPTEVTTTELTTTTTEATTTEVTTTTTEPITTTTTPPELTLEDMPAQYVEPMAWIWEERINDPEEGWVSYWDTIYDQIVAEDGHLYYVVKWQSYNELSLPQREQWQL